MLNENSVRVLTIDLDNQHNEITERADLHEYLGGVGLAVKLFDEYFLPDRAITDSRQPIVFACGPMSTIFPVVTKVVAIFPSPLTGELGESYAGMRLALAMRLAGLDAVVIKGRAAKPVYLAVSDEGVKTKDASHLWGLSCEETGRILRETEPGRGHRSCIRIGKAGENQIAFSAVNVDTFRHFGRLGLGAVMGNKNLKAMVIYGDRNDRINNYPEYNRVYQEIYQKVVTTDVMEKYHGVGTSINVQPLSEMKGLPTRNLQNSSFEYADKISGEAFARDSLYRKLACTGCPVGCIHIGLHRRAFDDNYEYEAVAVSYDHELIFALGSFLGMSSQGKIYELIDRVEVYGLDAISTGVALGWVTEAFAQGLITKEHLGIEVAFDNLEGYLHVIDALVKGENEFYQTLGRGAKAAAEKYGGQDFAMTLAGNEMAGYHTGYGAILGQLVGARHSHLDNAGYSFDQAASIPGEEELVEGLIKEEKERNVLNCLCICLFSRKVYDRDTVIKALGSIGINKTPENLTELGERIFKLKNGIKQKMGFKLQDVKVPNRFFETVSLNGQLNREIFERLVELYLKKMV
ncbi:MAG: aldehyde ferredoxin oxidoreductase C-terminal domain-containing protein [Thermincolia bacterium]